MNDNPYRRELDIDVPSRRVIDFPVVRRRVGQEPEPRPEPRMRRSEMIGLAATIWFIALFFMVTLYNEVTTTIHLFAFVALILTVLVTRKRRH